MTDVYPLNPKSCSALLWRGFPYGDTPEPDEFCNEDALEDSDYCHLHQWTEDDIA